MFSFLSVLSVTLGFASRNFFQKKKRKKRKPLNRAVNGEDQKETE